MRYLAAFVAILALTPLARADQDAAVKAAAQKGLKRVETGLVNYPKHRQCFSCHHHAVGVFSLTAARERGFDVDGEFVKKQIDFSLKTFRNRASIAKGQGVGGDSTSVVYMLNTLAAADYPADETTAALVQYLLVKQRKDGSWPFAAPRPPTMGSLFTNAGLAMKVLKRYGPPKDSDGAEELQKKIDAALAKARDWLIATKAVDNEDRVFKLIGLADAGADAKHVEAARAALLKEQREDGSWSQLADKPGDAYATATALVALRRGGLATTQPAYRKGVHYLLKTQTEDGAWVVQTRAKPLQAFFDNGDPGGKSQFISFAATNWALVALMETLPVVKASGE